MNIVVILGYRLNNDGSMRKELIERLDLGIETFNKVKPDYLVISGGMANFKAGLTEASQMYSYLIEHNIQEELIVVEDKSLTTRGNAFKIKRIFKDVNIENIYVVSNKFHFTRTNFPQAHKQFMKAFKKSNIIKVFREE